MGPRKLVSTFVKYGATEVRKVITLACYSRMSLNLIGLHAKSKLQISVGLARTPRPNFASIFDSMILFKNLFAYASLVFAPLESSKTDNT